MKRWAFARLCALCVSEWVSVSRVGEGVVFRVCVLVSSGPSLDCQKIRCSFRSPAQALQPTKYSRRRHPERERTNFAAGEGKNSADFRASYPHEKPEKPWVTHHLDLAQTWSGPKAVWGQSGAGQKAVSKGGQQRSEPKAVAAIPTAQLNTKVNENKTGGRGMNK